MNLNWQLKTKIARKSEKITKRAEVTFVYPFLNVCFVLFRFSFGTLSLRSTHTREKDPATSPSSLEGTTVTWMDKSLRLVPWIQTSLNSCDKSLRDGNGYILVGSSHEGTSRKKLFGCRDVSPPVCRPFNPIRTALFWASWDRGGGRGFGGPTPLSL